METPKIFESEYRFCCLVWETEPVNSGELARLAEARLGWKKSTTYTVIKRLSERGILKNENAVISALYTKEQVQRQESREFLDRTFGGSLPAFLAAFSGGGSLTAEEAEAIRRMIDGHGGERNDA